MKKVINKISPAERFWIGLGLYIIAADVFLWRNDHDTMSIEFGNWLKTPKGKLACSLGTAGMIAHLYVGMPLPLQTTAKKYLGGKL